VAAKLGLYRDPKTTREELSFKYIRGNGLEIGALHSPLPVRAGVSVCYVDRVDREESIRKFPHLDAAEVVDPHIDDGFVLNSISDASQDFLIANHVLEHASNPLAVLKNWARVLKPKGVLFVSVPAADKCFDKGRPLTTLDHFVEDYNAGAAGNAKILSERNRPHYGEWLRISEPNIYADRKEKYVAPSPEDMERRIDFLLDRAEEIHFHTFSTESFRSLLSYFADGLDTAMNLARLEGAESKAAEVRRVYARDLKMSGCLECGGCEKTGKCVVKDDMQTVYPHFEAADVIILASPIFFYAVTAQVKAPIDRSQAMWCKRFLEKGPDERKQYDSGKGYLIAVGATKGKSLFDCVKLEAKYFYDALDMTYEGGLFYRDLEKRSDVENHPDKLQEAFELGMKAVKTANVE